LALKFDEMSPNWQVLLFNAVQCIVGATISG